MLLRTLLLALTSLLSFLCFALPLYVIRPFRHQGARELAVALFVKQVGPTLSIVCALLALAIVIVSWRRWNGWLPKLGAAALLLFALGGAYLARVNVYELMFHPLGQPHFEAAKDAAIDKDDMVIAVRLERRSARLSDSRDGLPSRGKRHDWRRADRLNLLNALSHRSGVGAKSKWLGFDVPFGRHQQSELLDAR